MPKNYCIVQIWAESGKSALPICNYSQILYQFLTFTQNLKRSLFSFFLLRRNFVTGVDCHTHADQRAASEILVSLHQFLVARVEASCHAGKCSE